MKQIFLTAVAIASLTIVAPATGLAGPIDVSIHLDAYLPAPPGVRIQVEAGRPYYIVHDRRVYLEKKPKHKDNGKHRGHDKDREHGHGHGKKGKHD